jgi:hypothetical protein
MARKPIGVIGAVVMTCALSLSPLIWPAAVRAEGVPTATQTQFLKPPSEWRNVRYCEVVPLFRHGLNLTVDVYNTMGFNNCPAELWNRLDARQLAKLYGSMQVKLNGPRHWVLDGLKASGNTVDGQVVEIGGIQMRQRARIDLPLWKVIFGRKPYTETTVRRSTLFLYRQGRPVYELRSPAGDRYRMQAYAQIVDPRLTLADLDGLAGRLKLPKGWTYTVRTLTADESLAARGVAYVLQDELQNSYQKLQPRQGN